MTMIKRLSPREFARAMKLGLGRTLLHVAEYGDEGVEEIIKEAMLKSFAYDVQVEGLRTVWLWEIICLTGRQRVYGNYLLENFIRDGCYPYDVAQQFRLASCFFDIGLVEFRALLFAAIARITEHWCADKCGYSLIDVAGLKGLETIAKYASIFPSSFDDYTCNSILEYANDAGSEGEIEERLRTLSESDEGIALFLDRCAEFKRNQGEILPRSPNTQMSLEEFLALVESGTQSKYPGKSRQYGRKASAEDLEKVLELFETEKDIRKQNEYLQVFWYRTIPRVPKALLDWAISKKRLLRLAATSVLSRVNTDQVRNLGLSFLNSGKLCDIPFGLEVLEKSYRPCDADLVIASLRKLRNKERIHSAGMSVRTICEEAGGLELLPAITWLYEHGPDSFCRSGFLDLLIGWNQCTSDLIYEAQWDSGSDVQWTARNFYTLQSEVKRHDTV